MATAAVPKEKKPGKWENIINVVKEQLEILRGQGITPTLRGMHYRLSSLNMGYGNTKNEYKELSRQTARAREDGRLFINCFVDKGRDVVENGYMSNTDLEKPEDIINEKLGELQDLDEYYTTLQLPRWYNQEDYIEIWLEKAAQEDTFVHALRDREVRIVPNKGYSSLTFIWKNCKRLMQVAKDEPDKKIHIRYFGDFDPSGKDMDRDIVQRIEMLTKWTEGEEFDFERIAVNREHVNQYGLPPMPEDEETIEKYNNDPRKASFEAENGGDSYAVELDAFAVYAPDDYIKLIQEAVDGFFDEDVFIEEKRQCETPEFKQEIRQMIYDKTKEFLDGYEVGDSDKTDNEDSEEDEE
jgi:hypothetical protein